MPALLHDLLVEELQFLLVLLVVLEVLQTGTLAGGTLFRGGVRRLALLLHRAALPHQHLLQVLFRLHHLALAPPPLLPRLFRLELHAHFPGELGGQSVVGRQRPFGTSRQFLEHLLEHLCAFDRGAVAEGGVVFAGGAEGGEEGGRGPLGVGGHHRGTQFEQVVQQRLVVSRPRSEVPAQSVVVSFRLVLRRKELFQLLVRLF